MKLKLMVLAGLVISSQGTQADVVKDAKVQLDFRNLYMVRDPDTKQVPEFEHWSQSATLNIQSGYQKIGPLSLGLDGNVAYAHRLLEDEKKRDGSMPNDPITGEQLDDQTQLGITLKAKLADTEIRYGQLMPKLPVLHIDHSRNLPTTFKGLLIESRDIANTKITAGRINRIMARDKEDFAKLSLDVNKTGEVSDGLNIFGIDYKILPNLDVAYFYGGLEDIYDQHYVGLKHQHKFNDSTRLVTDLRYFDTQDAGEQLQGEIDSKSYNFMSMLHYGPHKFGLGYQHMSGDTAFPLLSGWTPAPFLTQWGSISFYKAGERSVQVRYDYDFADIGVPGLNFMTRYIKADHIKNPTIADVKESEFNIVMNYGIKDGTFKGLGFQYMLIKTDFEGAGIKLDEHRFYTNYSVKF
ncbi:MAG: OprD family porin [Candidatus Acinetobacter avistercoris]|uniref:OprD family outer membrane porin n=1 Tax=Acinetobacter sp. KS-LM10 TaxID=3120518 RepID=UPI001F9C75C7|nr:OprD family porin [Candidatus Acinetobacter avistercoris]